MLQKRCIEINLVLLNVLPVQNYSMRGWPSPQICHHDLSYREELQLLLIIYHFGWKIMIMFWVTPVGYRITFLNICQFWLIDLDKIWTRVPLVNRHETWAMIVHKGYRRCDSACCDLAFAKPNPMINTDLLIISCNYLSLICETEILCLPHFYLKCQFLYRISLDLTQHYVVY